MNDAGRWERVTHLFERAVELPPADRDTWLAGQVHDDPELLDTVRRMLSSDAAGEHLLDRGVAPAAHLVLEPETQLEPGTRVGAFDIVGELDRGGMGIVYAAKDRHLDRPVALKFVRVGGVLGGAERLVAEARAASALDHPNVSTVYQVGEADDGRYFIAMPRYEGETLRARLARGPLPPRQALEIARQVASGLAAAHRAGIVHRDIKPGNIFLTRDGSVKLLDFGIAALGGGARDVEAAGGTIPYMSPEQARQAPTDTRTDVWSLGVVLYRMLTGELPFPGHTAAETLAAIQGPQPAPRLSGRSGIAKRLARVVDRALQKEPSARFPDADALLEALANAKSRRSSRVLMAVGAAVIAVGSGWGAVALTSGESATDTPPTTLRLLPLGSESAEEGMASMAEAMVDEVTNRLSVVGVRVIGEADASAPGVGQGAHASVLEVSLERGETGHVLNAVVRDAEGAHAIWAKPRAFSPEGLRELSRELALGVLQQLGVDLTARDYAALEAGMPSSVEAYQALLAGNRLIKQRTPAAVLAAIGRYSEARRLDSAFASAYARGSYAISLLADWGWSHPTLSRAELLAQAVALSDSAVALDSTSAETWLARAYVMVAADPRHLSGAPDAFRRAIAIAPYNAEAYYQYGQAAMVLGRFDEAATAYRRALELRPDDAMSLISMAGLADLRGRRDEATRLADSAVTVAPRMAFAHAIRALAHSYQGEYRSAEREARLALSLDSTFQVPALAMLAMARAGQGDTAGARAWASRARAARATDTAASPDEAHLLAHAFLAAGDRQAAIEVVRRARPRGALLWYLFQLPYFNEFRREPAVAAVLTEADPRRPEPGPLGP